MTWTYSYNKDPVNRSLPFVATNKWNRAENFRRHLLEETPILYGSETLSDARIDEEIACVKYDQGVGCCLVQTQEDVKYENLPYVRLHLKKVGQQI